MSGYSKVRQLVTGNPGLDTFIREVRTSLGELQTSVATTPSGLEWDINHALAFSFSQTGTTTLRNEGSAGIGYTLTLGGSIQPRLGFPSPVGNAMELASETTGTSYAYGAGSYPVKTNDFSIEFMAFTHFAPYARTVWDGYVPIKKSSYFYSSLPASGPPSTIDAVAGSFGTVPTREVTIPTGQWNHIMFTASSTDGKRLYMNGAIVATNTNTTAVTANTNDWYFGGADATNYKFYGALARFAYSTVVRPQSYAISVTKQMRGW